MFRLRLRGADLKVHVRTPRAHELSLPGYGYYLVHPRDRAKRLGIDAFAKWIMTVAKILCFGIQLGLVYAA